MRKVSIQRGWPPATPIALNTKDEDGIGLINLVPAGIKERREFQHRQARRSVETVLVEMAQGRLRSRREFDELEDIRCGFRPARSYKELINEQYVRIFIVHSCIGAVPIAGL
jgi:hypothetical protein